MPSRVLEAHLRLMGLLPVRTEEARARREVREEERRGHGMRRIETGGVVYEGTAHAKRELRIGSARLYEMLRTGKARYV